MVVCVALCSYVINKILIKFSNRIGSMANGEANKVQQIRWASHSKPLVGGISFYLIYLFTLLSLMLDLPTKLGIPVTGGSPDLLPLFLASTVGFFVGLADDAYTTKPFLKFLGQFACSIILLGFGIRIELFHSPVLDSALTIFWVVAIMNSINMLDNMDAVTGSVSMGIFTIALAIQVVAGAQLGITDPYFYWLTLGFIGGLLGFLYLNWNPSKLYMGDTGSQFLGLVLAFYGIRYFWNLPTSDAEHAPIFTRSFVLAVLAFLVPILDTTFVTIARLRRGQSPFVGGRDHTTHHLVYFGIQDKFVPVVMLILTALSGSLVLVIVKSIASGWSHLDTLFFAAYVAGIFGIFLYIYQTGLNNRKRKEAEQAAQADELLLDTSVIGQAEFGGHTSPALQPEHIR